MTIETHQETRPRKKREPSGIVTTRPIAMRLMPDELEQVKKIALREQRSMASVCRLAMLRGLADYQQAGLLD